MPLTGRENPPGTLVPPITTGEEGSKVWICSKVEKEVKNDGIGTDEHVL
jgi:hypothetical protein